MKYSAIRYHDFSCGHRVMGHENKCAHLHGHNYRVHFEVSPRPLDGLAPADSALDKVGRVLDFGTINLLLCQWLEANWDHRFLAWVKDNAMVEVQLALRQFDESHPGEEHAKLVTSIVWVPFNPTAENMAHYLLTVVAPRLLQNHSVRVTRVLVEETRKCSAEVSL